MHKCEDAVRAKAKERQESTQFGGAGNISLTTGQARDELGLMAGVSGKTYEHAVKVLNNAPQDTLDALRRGEMSINQAYQTVRREEKKQEVQQRIEIVHKCEDAVRAKAKERQATSTGGTTPQLREIFPKAEKGRANDELGAMAGVSAEGRNICQISDNPANTV